MGNFRRDNNDRNTRDRGGAGGRFFGGRSGFGRNGDRSNLRNDRSNFRGDSQREMFKTICSNCGKECEVPFRPTSGKPVYCSDCFEKMGGRNSDSGRNDRSERSEAPRVDNTKQLNELSAKLDKIIALLTPKKEEKVITEEVISVPVSKEVIEEKEVKTPKVKKPKKVKEEVVV